MNATSQKTAIRCPSAPMSSASAHKITSARNLARVKNIDRKYVIKLKLEQRVKLGKATIIVAFLFSSWVGNM